MFTFNIYQKPTALYADRLSKILDTNCNARIAKIAEISIPPNGGMNERKILRYGSIIGLRKDIALYAHSAV
jgi:hypothetical protein|tara:strand:+ start:1489 stop:1701 length:213 start_codon:yes stop_codon:yes gene_type:complete